MNESRLEHIDNVNEMRLRELAAETAVALEAEREGHIRERERDVERERIAAPLVQEPAAGARTVPAPDPWGLPVSDRVDAPGEHGEEFGGCWY